MGKEKEEEEEEEEGLGMVVDVAGTNEEEEEAAAAAAAAAGGIGGETIGESLSNPSAKRTLRLPPCVWELVSASSAEG